LVLPMRVKETSDISPPLELPLRAGRSGKVLSLWRPTAPSPKAKKRKTGIYLWLVVNTNLLRCSPVNSVMVPFRTEEEKSRCLNFSFDCLKSRCCSFSSSNYTGSLRRRYCSEKGGAARNKNPLWTGKNLLPLKVLARGNQLP
jgi:hypothetical protein